MKNRDNKLTPTPAPKPPSVKARLLAGKPVVKFTGGSFKSFRYDKNTRQIVRVQ